MNLVHDKVQRLLHLNRGLPWERVLVQSLLSVFVFYRPSGNGPITEFAVISQFLLAGDQSWPLGN